MKKLETLVFEALGEASMCWSETPKGVFQDSKAKDIGDKLIDTIQALTSVKSEQVANNSEAMKWISVEDRLPEYGTQILVYGIDKAMYGVKKFHVCEMDDLEDGMEFQESRSFYWLTEKGTKIDNVTHWTPLPTTPNQ